MIRLFSVLISIFLCAQVSIGQQKFKQISVASKKIANQAPPLSDHTYFPNYEELTKPINYNSIKNLTIDFDNLKVVSYAENGTPNLIQGSLPDAKQYKSLKNQVDAYLESAAPKMGINNDQIEFKKKREWQDELGMSHQKLTQNYKGIPIYGSEIIIHTDREGIVNRLNGNYFATEQINLELGDPMPEHQAQEIITPNFKSYDKNLKLLKGLIPDIQQWKSELIIYPHDNKFTMAWHMEVHPNMGAHDTYFIDAVSGEILNHYSNICNFYGHHHEPLAEGGPESTDATDLLGNEQNINTYEHDNKFYLIDASRSMFDRSASIFPNKAKGVIITFDARNNSPQQENFDYFHFISSDNNWSQPVAVSSQANAETSYEYYKQVHKREAITGEGDNIYSWVNVSDEDGDPLDNAYWNGIGIWYGNGNTSFEPLGGALDVAGHEMTHGVVQKMVGLNHTDEPGALGESFADIFGCMIERKNWTLGETVVKRSAYRSGALRNMADPHNGVSQGQRGWQPKHYSERYLGDLDRGGVHINSGIINHAYYLFATEVGIDKAEKVFYRVLESYLTKSAQFIDARIAVLQAADDLYTSSVVRAAEKAFDAVGVTGTQGSNAQEDVQSNDGDDLILYSTDDKSKLILANGDFDPIANPLSETGIISRPSVTDAGDQIVFVGKDKKMHLITIDWTAKTFAEKILQDSPTWRNAVISKNGRWVAALAQRDDQNDNRIIVYDRQNGNNKIFELSNPTFTEGVSTGDVLYADAMEFDFTNHVIVYDAINRINSSSAGDVEYWDVGFLSFWDSDKNSWADGNIGKLFTSLPEGVSVGNPAFSKNSPYIIALDFLNENEDNEWQIIGVNVETSEVDLIKKTNNIGFPSYSRNDKFIIHNGTTSATASHLQTTPLSNSKISGRGTQTSTAIRNAEWGVWFSNGQRDFSSSIFETDVIADELSLFPNPVNDLVTIKLDKSHGSIQKVDVFDIVGRKVVSENYYDSKGKSELKIKVTALPPGIYNLICNTEEKIFAAQFIKD